MNSRNLFKLLAALCVSTIGFSAMADDKTIGQEIKEAGQDIGKGARKTARKVKDETCEMVNGKMECVAKKAKHKIKNGIDEVKDKSND